jgi:hypothetical protein
VEADAAVAERLAALEGEQAVLREALARTEAERERYRTLYLQLLEAYEKLKRGLLGQQAERLPPDARQLTLALLATVLGEAGAPPAAATQTIPTHTRTTPTGRKPLPEHLPRVDVELIPPEVQEQGLAQFARIGEELTPPRLKARGSRSPKGD